MLFEVSRATFLIVRRIAGILREPFLDVLVRSISEPSSVASSNNNVICIIHVLCDGIYKLLYKKCKNNAFLKDEQSLRGSLLYSSFLAESPSAYSVE